jgi:amidase
MKDQFHIEGMPTSAGYIGWIGTFEGKTDSEKYMKSESLLVEQLKSLGAIPIGKVSLGQSEITVSVH